MVKIIGYAMSRRICKQLFNEIRIGLFTSRRKVAASGHCATLSRFAFSFL